MFSTLSLAFTHETNLLEEAKERTVNFTPINFNIIDFFLFCLIFYRIVACYSSDVRRMSAEGAVMCSENSCCSSSLQYRQRHRKFSYPVSFHSNTLQPRNFPDINNSVSTSVLSRRRFSNVGDVVSRKLSTTIGWRHTQVQSRHLYIAAFNRTCVKSVRHRLTLIT